MTRTERLPAAVASVHAALRSYGRDGVTILLVPLMQVASASKKAYIVVKRGEETLAHIPERWLSQVRRLRRDDLAPCALLMYGPGRTPTLQIRWAMGRGQLTLRCPILAPRDLRTARITITIDIAGVQ